MDRPIIGITTGRRNLQPKPDQRQTALMGVPLEYVDCIVAAGGAPLLLPRADEPDVVARVMTTVDGLLLSGGGDVGSLTYGQQPHPKACYQDPIRDGMEIRATQLAVEAGLPVLGICRGLQLLNVALGGTLVQDIRSEVPGACQHFAKERESFLAHTVDIEPDSLLARVWGPTSTAVNTWHHQAADAIAEGLRTSARAPDGVVEALEADDGRPILAVQCHPEDCAHEHPLFQKLFDWLVAEAARAAPQPGEPLTRRGGRG